MSEKYELLNLLQTNERSLQDELKKILSEPEDEKLNNILESRTDSLCKQNMLAED